MKGTVIQGFNVGVMPDLLNLLGSPVTPVCDSKGVGVGLSFN
jgi:hypothetical protein